MTLTSSAVWSMTEPSEVDPSTKAGAGKTIVPKSNGPKVDDDRPKTPPKLVDKSTFLSGKTLLVEGRLGHARMLANATSETYLFVDVRSEVEGSSSQPFGPAGDTRASFEPLNLA